MNWDAIGAIGEIVGALAVLVTLLVLVFQLRQNTKEMRANSVRSLQEKSIDPSLATLYADLIREQVHIVAPGQNDVEKLDPPRMRQGNEMYLRQFDFFFAQSISSYSPRFDETPGFKDHASVSDAAEVLKLVDLAKESDRKGARIRISGDGN